MNLNDSDKIKKAKQYIEFLEKAYRDGMGNIVSCERISKKSYRENYEKSGYQYFMLSGDYHYFVGRILFLQRIGVYAFFSAYQCIENYLKAYLKYKGEVPPHTHDLINLLKLAQQKSLKGSFLRSRHCKTVINKYLPFYELPRYPVQQSRPKGGAFGYLFPDDIYPIDYFIYKMRELMPLPKGTYDLLEEGFPYGTVIFKDHFPELIELFKQENINF